MKLLSHLSRLPILLAFVVVFLVAEVLFIRPAGDFIANASTSQTTNFYLVGIAMLLVVLVSLALTALLVRVVWGKRYGETAALAAEEAEEDDVIASVRGMRSTGTQRAVIFVVILVLCTIAFDQVGGGILVSETRTYRVLTGLRSNDAQQRVDVVHDSIMLLGEQRVTEALVRVVREEGAAREWAAYALGVRGDTGAADAIASLMASGNDRERAGAAAALARLKDPRLVELVVASYPKMSENKSDVIAALGMIGRKTLSPAPSKEAGAGGMSGFALNGDAAQGEDDLLGKAGRFLASVLAEPGLTNERRHLAVWALGELAVADGLQTVEELLDPSRQLETTCVALRALGRIGAADTSPKLVALIGTTDKELRCPELVYKDLFEQQLLIDNGGNVIEILLKEIANIGDRRALAEMERLSKDESFSSKVRSYASSIAYQMRYKSGQ